MCSMENTEVQLLLLKYDTQIAFTHILHFAIITLDISLCLNFTLAMFFILDAG